MFQAQPIHTISVFDDLQFKTKKIERKISKINKNVLNNQIIVSYCFSLNFNKCIKFNF